MIGLEDFEGHWCLARRILDRRGRMLGRFEGMAVFAPDETGLRYSEAGTLRLGAAPPVPARRAYLWRAEGAGIAVLFEDGRPFHRFSAAAPAARHDCAPDLYLVRYGFGHWPCWSARWRVTGPAKDYVMLGLYRRPQG
ncbi:MAG: DUF6314 family protein [Paracoccaceae bacterium]